MKKGEIWQVVIPATNGHEQSGIRPVVVLSEVEVNIVSIVPITSNLQALRYPRTITLSPTDKNGLTKNSVALVFQLRAIDKKRLKKKIGELETGLLDKVDNMIKDMLNL